MDMTVFTFRASVRFPVSRLEKRRLTSSSFNSHSDTNERTDAMGMTVSPSCRESQDPRLEIKTLGQRMKSVTVDGPA
jgi:hypothetical protein